MHIPDSQWWQTLLKQPELVDSRMPPAVSRAWDPDTERECDRWNKGEIQKERKCTIEREKRRGAHNRRLRTELVDTAPPLLFLALKPSPSDW